MVGKMNFVHDGVGSSATYLRDGAAGLSRTSGAVEKGSPFPGGGF